MVAVTGGRSSAKITVRVGWTLASVGVLVIGSILRLAIGNGGVGDRSAVVLLMLLSAGAWAAARVLAGSRAAFISTLALVALLDLAALPARNSPEYDDVQALYRTDQVLTAQLAAAGPDSALVILGQAVFGGAQPEFGLAGDINGAALSWSCDWRRGMGHVVLPVGREVLQNASTAEVRLWLTGTPSREGDYLLVYTSSGRGGRVASFEAGASASHDAINCILE